MTDQFCYYHIIAREDVGKNSFTCTAHLNEGRAFRCPYRISEIYEEESKRLRISHRRGKDLFGVCEDFEFIKLT